MCVLRTVNLCNCLMSSFLKICLSYLKLITKLIRNIKTYAVFAQYGFEPYASVKVLTSANVTVMVIVGLAQVIVIILVSYDIPCVA